ncbi:MAG: hypothetical protein UV82_C0011G0093 [Candidatus Magasanikbacteria bacterium GW2011_GWD2_43_18]|nr:MAG: hypothetical protein UV18_C0014G0002 [Candidatus Magasanikbacteria bacterium GW2011_GWC2_42_27]KKT04165.1 MAG: hypothetical protein UV82_C0011G0093 [Candidatus Magasanikbacteria bacterium GW2011_GWD2_43_18]KKT25658.1 MAG: hypothetical protein UW10_C0005G0025 [Candidatus Magasanikbacteria bacterium GW2011_GWA2_43_9]HAQ02119.1 hypothetical protein [Candidatus Campbellbacteria bacterium]HBB38480.1 hypothetical protein [Candidatus Magasanikbacteria bacterium]
MPDQYTEVTKKSWGSRLGGSIGGIFFGILLFLASFAVLFWNEGRVGLSETAKDATPFDASVEQLQAPADGTLVAASGVLSSVDEIGDGQFLKNGNYLIVRRNVETYAWVEKSQSTTETKIGGSQETKTTYDYEKQWVSTVPDSSNFKVRDGHMNQPKEYQDVANIVPTATVGVYGLDPTELVLPGSHPLTLTEEIVNLPENGELVGGEYMYIGGFSMNDPVVGNTRISYDVLPAGDTVTVFGALNGKTISPYFNKDGQKLYEARMTGFEASVIAMETEHSRSLWIWRVVGFLMMWIGLGMVLAPLSVLLDVLPFLGSLSRGAVSLATGLISIVLSVVTILVSMIFHNVVALVLAVLIAIVGVVYVFKKKGKK